MINPFIRKKEEIRSYSINTEGSFFNDLSGSAMQIPGVFASVSYISNAIASVTIENSPKILDREPQENMTRYMWLNGITKNILLHGNAFAQIKGNELVLLDPRNVFAMYDPTLQTIIYYQFGTQKIYPESMLHFRNICKDNLSQVGYSSLDNFANTFSREQAMSEYQGNYMINGSRPSMWVSTAKGLKQEAVDAMKSLFSSYNSGTRNTGKVPVMPDGIVLNQLKTDSTLVDADLVLLKQASLKEIANVFLLPVSMLDNSLSNYGNAIEANVQFLKMTLNPLLTNIKEEINLKLNCNCSFDTSSLIEGSFSEKIATLSSALSSGLLTANECRQRLNYKELEDGKVLYIPAGSPSTETPTPGETK